MQTYINLLCNVFCQNPRSDWFKFVNVARYDLMDLKQQANA